MFILAFIICTVVIFIVSTKINRKRYDELNLMLNQILEGKEVLIQIQRIQERQKFLTK
ncbi:hypothetical protein [Clostridioides difficile]|uniref:hypothetical protein n=1 Tax=Clostridioides difficile TaxID=1496 RepID=UPI001F1B8D11|nr:hypothetical protein [Clostridioides difficile]